MTYRRLEPPPPPPDPPSMRLLRAVGDRQRATGAERIDPEDLATQLGYMPQDIPPLVRRGIAAGYLVAVSGKVGLSVQGWAWYEWDRLRRT